MNTSIPAILVLSVALPKENAMTHLTENYWILIKIFVCLSWFCVINVLFHTLMTQNV